jgi:hypothetical protein
MTAAKELAENMRFLRNAAPQEYERFVAAFANFTRSITDELIVTTVELPLIQGRVQQCVKLLRMLEEIKNG